MISKIVGIIIMILNKEVFKQFLVMKNENIKHGFEQRYYESIHYCKKAFASPGDHAEYREVFLLANPES